MSKGQAYRPSQYGMRPGTVATAPMERKHSARRVPPEDIEQALDDVVLESTVANMLAKIKNDILIRQTLGDPNPLKLLLRLKNEIDNLLNQ